MRRVKVTVCLLFVISCILFAVYMLKTRVAEDRQPPVITCEEEEISLSVKAEQSELLKGVTAKDNEDGDLTKSIRISGMSHFIEKGKRTVTYAVFDNSNLAATVQRTIVYTDYESPKIRVTKPLRFSAKGMNTSKIVGNMTASDCLDGDLTNQIYATWEEDVYSFEPGTYTVTLQVSNSAGDVCAVPVEVVVLESVDDTENQKNYPVLADYVLYTTVGQEVDLYSNLTGVTSGGKELSFVDDAGSLSVSQSNIGIQSHVDYSTPGTYPVEYVYTNKEGNTAVTKLFVVVEE